MSEPKPDEPQIIVLPNSFEAERGLLCAFLKSPREIGEKCATRRITVDHFYHYPHLEAFAVANLLWAADKPIDFIIVTQCLRDLDLLDKVGGAAFVTEVFDFGASVHNADNYLDTVEKKYRLRQINDICAEYGLKSTAERGSPDDMLNDLQGRIGALGAQPDTAIPTMRQNVLDVLDVMASRASGKSVVMTGLKALDEMVGPLERGNLVVIGGQTKSGKSILAGQIALNIALEGKPVLFLSLEMSEREITARWLASISRVNMRLPHAWSEMDYGRFNAAKETVAKLPIHVVCRRYGIAELMALCQQFASRHAGSAEPLACIILDYAQIAESSKRGKDDRRQQEVAEISRACKRAAGKHNVLFVLLSQLNDDGRTREGRDIEMDANLMLEVGVNADGGNRRVKVVLARSAPMGQLLKLRIIPEHTRVEDDERMDISDEPETKKPAKRKWHN